MPPDAYFHCLACGAKLRLGPRPKPRVACPRCGYVFEYEATQASDPAAATNLDPFLEPERSADSPEAIVDPFAEPEPAETAAGEGADFATTKKRAAGTPRAAKSNVGPAAPAVRTFAPRVMPPPELEPRKKTGKRKKQVSSPDVRRGRRLLIYAGGGALIVVLSLVVLRFVVFGHRLTLDDIAGTYICDKNADIRVTLYTDGTCAVEDFSNDSDLNVGDIEYTFDGRKKITLKPSREMKHLKLKPVELIIFLARGPSRIDEAVDKFNDLTFEQGTLYSQSKGRFTRESDRDDADEAREAKAAKPKAAKPKAAAGKSPKPAKQGADVVEEGEKDEG